MLSKFALATEITLDLMDLLLGILIIVGIVFVVYLIILLAKLVGTMKKVNKLVDSLDEPVTKTVAQLPDMMKKLDAVTQDVAVLTSFAKESVPHVLDDVQVMTGTVRGGVEAVGGAARAVGDGVSKFFHPSRASHGMDMNAIMDIVNKALGVVSFFASRGKSQKKTRKTGRR